MRHYPCRISRFPPHERFTLHTMPRNIRRKAAPAKSKRRRNSDTSSSLDLSSDGGYSALGEVSDSEDDDEDDVYAAEEKHIIQAVTKSRHAPSPRPPVQNEEEDADEEEADGAGSDDDDDEDDDDGDDEDDLEELDDADFTEFAFEENTNNGGNDDTPTGKAKFADDGASWNGVSESDANQAGGAALPAKRQVRFAGVPDSDSDSTTSDASVHDSQFFPDIFVEQGSLDPGFRREIEHDSDSSVSSSFWDYSSGYGHDQEPLLTFSDADLLAAELPDPNADVFPQALADEDDKKEEGVDEEENGELDGYESEFEPTKLCASFFSGGILHDCILLLTHLSQPMVTLLRMRSHSTSLFGGNWPAASSLSTAMKNSPTPTRMQRFPTAMVSLVLDVLS